MKTDTAPSSANAMALDLRLRAVEEKMRLLCADPDWPGDLYNSALDDHLDAGGQRSRSQISLGCGTALGLRPPDLIALASSVELLHNASLIQDDLQDKTLTRRGCPTVWSRYGADCAIGLTDLTIASAFRALGEVSQPKAIPGLIESLCRAISSTIRGQTDDLAGKSVSLDHVLSIARRKSGPLFALALELPLYLAGHQEFLHLASKAAGAFGLGYQIYDDIIDLEEDRASRSRSNTVIVLEMNLPPEEALHAARRLAMGNLQSAASMASDLPANCGQALADLAAQVGKKLNDLFDE